MVVVRRTFFEALILGLVGLAVGFGYNGARSEGAIDPWKNYFDKQVDGYPLPPSLPGADDGAVAEPGFQTISFADVVDVFNDPDTELGLNVFIDARKAEPYKEGHIPGAIRCDPYEGGECVEELVEVAAVADRVIAYCNGGNCEDSIFICRDLLAAGLDCGIVYLFEGGWEEWKRSGSVPLATGSPE